jgi:predicted RNA-binding protein associated with RNAse of E/G family
MKGASLMTKPLLYRRRFIPDELIHLKDDTILVLEPNLIITKWDTLHPRKDIARGISAFYLDKGFKVSKVFNLHGEVVYWYCDIIQVKKDDEKNTVIIEDLLIDLILYEDGSMRIMDLNELADALDKKLITQEEATYALHTANSLLQIIYSGHFHTLQESINSMEPS